ncbi:transmembrane protein 184C isoform X2 [Frankliniella occidentalis]|uniref:Transmembrane protein 184C isoform X2 n=1 Tax=Frankliniella occidentalis TaxID=133901 RepID=A0A6J1T438_FRAOC|nr:transmembrane protein 184C isoform X2 [Frankliniella occidentalis]
MCLQALLSFFRKWRYWIRPAVMTVYTIVIVMLLPILVVRVVQNGFQKSDQGILIGGVFVLMALPIAFWQITQHMVHYTKPRLQKHIIRILWMVPLYATNAWLGMIIPAQSIYFDSLRECYEAYVIYNFMKFLFNYLNEEEVNFVSNLELKPQTKHFFPLCCLPTWEMGRELVHNCKHGILQYAVVRPVTTAISFICELADVYKEGEFKGNSAFPYMIAVNNFSQFIAMYCLVLFYKANKEELSPMKPIGKFLCIKAVVFFSFFQGVIISLLVYTGVISSVFGTEDQSDVKDISSRLQDFLICIEMFLAAVAHHYSFSYKPYVNDAAEHKSCCDAFLAMWDLSDVHSDVKEHIGVVGQTLGRHIGVRGFYKQESSSADERSYLLLAPLNPLSDDEGEQP